MISIGSIKLPSFSILLAPMEDVSDPPFRKLCKEQGADVVYTEFVSSEGLIRKASKSLKKLDIFEYERPVGIQIFGGNQESMIKCVDIVEKVSPDFIDINYGCPVKKVVSKGSGAAILKDINKMVSLTKAIVKRSNIPVTVKTRLGWDENSIHIVEVAERLQDVGIKAIAIHGRTRSQMYKGKANWDYIAKVKNNPRIYIPVFGNGDVDTPQKALEMKVKYCLDGVMIGRASIGNPWFFRQVKHFLETGKEDNPISLKERIQTIKKHLLLSIKWKGERSGIYEMRRHYSNYFRAIPGIKPFKIKLVLHSNKESIYETLEEIEKNFINEF